MRRRRLCTLIATIAVLSLGTIAALAVASTAGARPLVAAIPPTTVPPPGSGMPVSVAPPASMNQPGGTAIRPRAVSTDPALPSFSAADVRAYVSAHPHPDQASGAAPATIAGVEFLPAQAMESRLGGATGRPATALFCLVTLRGSFAVAGPPGTGWSSDIAYLVFDAHTGNILVEVVGR